MFTDDTILSFGKYKAYRLRDVPAFYLINLHKNGGGIDPDLRKYINDNIDSIRARFLDFPEPINRVTFICEKRTFPTKKDAMDSIKKPAKQDKKRPIRAYECPKCSGWHLTSKEVEEYKKTVERFKTNL